MKYLVMVSEEGKTFNKIFDSKEEAENEFNTNKGAIAIGSYEALETKEA